MNILLVDEDSASLDELRSTLERREGTQVLTADSAAEGFAAVESWDEVDVLITAALMAPQDGFHLRSALRARFPDIRVAFISKTDLSRHFDKIGDDIVFYKPINVQALLDWLNRQEVGVLVEPEEIPVPAEMSASVAVEELPVPSAAPPMEEGEFGSREGAQIGDYQLGRLLQITDRTETYEALQSSVQRKVAFTLLRDTFRSGDPAAVEEFVQEVRAKAAVLHQHIAPVYESHQEGDILFYTRELIEGEHLGELEEKGERLEVGSIISLIRVVAESFEYMCQRGIPFCVLRSKDIYLMKDDQARLVNLASAPGSEGIETRSEPEQIRHFAQILAPLAPLEGGDGGEEIVAKLLYMMAHERDREVNGRWATLRQSAQAFSRELEKGSSYELPDMERKARAASRRKAIMKVAIITGLVIILGFLARGVGSMVGYLGRPKAKDFSNMIRIPAGKFHYQDGSEDPELEAFWIDEYEVTIGQYGEFLEALKKSPPGEFDHPDQPGSKVGHEPSQWSKIYRIARRGEELDGQPIDLNCPVMLVDWWDAYAYAQWKGRRLPTEEEWEKAARGRVGNPYPWGEEFSAVLLNSGMDFTEEAFDVKAGSIDGFCYWAPVDAFQGDSSAYDVKGTGGNVSEWTSSWEAHREFPDRLVPVVRGGSFRTEEGFELSLRRPVGSPEERLISVGFRTASSQRPAEAAELE